MRPPANIIARWMKEKNSFPVRGLVMLRVPGKGWMCNIEILRTKVEKLDQISQDEAAFEIALSAVFRYITSTVYSGESVPVVTTRGTGLFVPKIAFDMAPFLVAKVKKILAEGGGGINVAQVAISQKFLARAATGSSKDAEAYGLPMVIKGAARVKHRLEYEAQLTQKQANGMARRRKKIARFWLKRAGGGFYHRGVVYSSDSHGFWAFNVGSGHEMVEHTSEDQSALEALALEVSTQAVLTYARAVNFERDGETLIENDRSGGLNESRLPPDLVDGAAPRVARRLLALMAKNKHGVLSHKVIERALVLAWDPEDEKSLEDYPFPLAPTSDYLALDRKALDHVSIAIERSRKFKHKDSVDTAPQPGIPAGSEDEDAPPKTPTSWREALEIDDWVPLDEPVEDDETLDRRALEKADHEQSAALRRIRGPAGGRILPDDTATPLQHKVDYAGLPKDED